jgi:hypothetical protein
MDDSGFPPADHTPTDVVDHMADPSSTALSGTSAIAILFCILSNVILTPVVI